MRRFAIGKELMTMRRIFYPANTFRKQNLYGRGDAGAALPLPLCHPKNFFQKILKFFNFPY